MHVPQKKPSPINKNIISDMVFAYLTGFPFEKMPEDYKKAAASYKTDDEKLSFIVRYLFENWASTPDETPDEKIQIDTQKNILIEIFRRIKFEESIIATYPPDVKKSFALRIEKLKKALSGQDDFDINYKFANEAINNFLNIHQVKNKKGNVKLFNIKLKVAEAIAEYFAQSGIHTRTSAAIRIRDLQTETPEMYYKILNAEVNALLENDANSTLGVKLNKILKEEKIKESVKERHTGLTSLNKQIAKLILDYANNIESIKNPLRLAAALIISGRTIGELAKFGHDILKCNNAEAYQAFLNNLSNYQTSIENSEKTPFLVIQEVIKLIEATLNLSPQKHRSAIRNEGHRSIPKPSN